MQDKLWQNTAVILAGGRSTRMGQDKSLLAFAGAPSLAAYVAGRLKACFGEVYFSLHEKKELGIEQALCLPDLSPDELRGLVSGAGLGFGGFGLSDAPHSPVLGLASVLARFRQPVYIQPVDMPFVSHQSIKRLFDSFANTGAVVARSGGRTHWLCGVFSPKLAPKLGLSYLQGRHRVGEILSEAGALVLDFENDEEFLNLNNPTDVSNALRILNEA